MGLLASIDASMVNSDMTVNVDAEGVAVPNSSGLWICSEGAGAEGEEGRTLNLLMKVNEGGEIMEVVTLPNDVNLFQIEYGFEGCAMGSGDFEGKVPSRFILEMNSAN